MADNSEKKYNIIFLNDEELQRFKAENEAMFAQAQGDGFGHKSNTQCELTRTGGKWDSTCGDND